MYCKIDMFVYGCDDIKFKSKYYIYWFVRGFVVVCFWVKLEIWLINEVMSERLLILVYVV